MAQANTSAARDEVEEEDGDRSTAEVRPAAPPATVARVTVNLSAKSAEALEEGVQLARNTKTEVINKALQLFALVQRAQNAGGGVSIKDSKDAEWTRIQFF